MRGWSSPQNIQKWKSTYFQTIKTLLIENKLQNIKIILDLPEVLCILHLSPQIWSVSEWRDRRPFLMSPAAPTPTRASLGWPRGQEANQRSMKSTPASASSSYHSPIPSRPPIPSGWRSFWCRPGPLCQLCTWAASLEEHIPSCQTFSVTSSALNF